MRSAFLAQSVTAVCLWLAWLMPVSAAPPKVDFREAKADFRDKELALTYVFGNSGALDFALTDRLSAGVAVDNLWAPLNWYYRGTWQLVSNPESGLFVAFNAGALQSRVMLAGNQVQPPTWGWQSGMLVSLLTESGLTLRAGFQLYNTDWSSSAQRFAFTPELAYRIGILEATIIPTWPFSLSELGWAGLRLRL
jgi:hypothetical protein